ncbi:MAG: hypothetical protein AABZ60_07685 [Planctomycetota bacterium]
MKITINISKLLKEKKISQEEYDRLLALAKQESIVHAWGVLTVMAIIAIVIGFIGLFPEVFSFFINALGNFFLAIYTILGHEASQILLFLAILSLGVIAKSGFLVGISCFVILGLLGGMTGYEHASYFLAIQEPMATVLIFSLLSLGGLFLSFRLTPEFERLAIIFSRTCLIFVNLGFWIGSLWGSAFLGGEVPSAFFSIGWALGLVITLIWGAQVGRLFVVNSAVSFGIIHFYTQWFEFFGSNPFTLFLSGLIALGLIYGIPRYNNIIKKKISTNSFSNND